MVNYLLRLRATYVIITVAVGELDFLVSHPIFILLSWRNVKVVEWVFVALRCLIFGSRNVIIIAFRTLAVGRRVIAWSGRVGALREELPAYALRFLCAVVMRPATL